MNIWLEKLGGFRTGGYLKYMRAKQYREGISELLKIAEHRLLKEYKEKKIKCD